MSTIHQEPIGSNWTTTEPFQTDEPSTARQLALAIGPLDLDTIRNHHLELTLAVSELASNAGKPWPWTADDPTVALVRALARLAVLAPDTRADAAGRLVERLAST